MQSEHLEQGAQDKLSGEQIGSTPSEDSPLETARLSVGRRKSRHDQLPYVVADPGMMDVPPVVVPIELPKIASILERDDRVNYFLGELAGALEGLDDAAIQELDERKLPPLTALKKLTAKQSFVPSVDVPHLCPENSLLHNESIRALISEEKLAALETLAVQTEQVAPAVAELGKSGRSLAMVHMALELPDLASVGTGTFLGVNNGLSAHALGALGTTEQQAFWLSALNSGILTYGFGLTEEAVGSDPRSISTRYTEVEEADGSTSYIINGDKKWIGNAAPVYDEQGELVHPGADFIIIFAVDDPSKAPKDRNFKAFMVPRTAIGEENIRPSGKEHNKLGLREVNNGDFDMKDVKVPAAAMLGNPDHNIYSDLAAMLDITRLYVGAMSTGASDAALKRANEYTMRRDQNGRTIVDYQMVRFPLEDLAGETLASKLLCVRSALCVDKARSTLEQNADRLEAARQKAALLGEQYPTESEELRAALSSFPSPLRIHRRKEELLTLYRDLNDRIPDQRSEGNHRLLQQIRNELNQIQSPPHFGRLTAMAKLFGSELADRATNQAINALGGNGFSENPEQGLGLPKRRRDAKVLSIYEGTSNIQRNIIAADVLAEAARSMKDKMAAVETVLRANPIVRGLSEFARPWRTSYEGEVESIVKNATASTLVAYQREFKRITKQWSENGVPEKFRGWDQKSIERQKHMEASTGVQQRLGLLADLVTRQELASVTLEELRSSESPLSDREAQLLELFFTNNTREMLALSREIHSPTLRDREQTFRTLSK